MLTGSQLEGKRLLIVDDNAINRMILTHFSGLWGASPKATASARDALNWIHHGEVFDLPNDCVPLAGSEIAPLQAFRYGARAYGLLFHLEIEEKGIDSLCRECAADLTKARLTAHQVRGAALPYLPQLHQVADRLVAHLLDSAR